MEVGRAVFELSERHGWNAHLYAARLARKAEAAGQVDEQAFWKAVSASLTPREH